MRRGLKKEHITLRDGRKLCYVVDRVSDDGSGDDDKDWVFFFHGMFVNVKSLIPRKQLQLNCVYVNRPGYGGSDRVPCVGSWTYGMFAKDIEELADSLKIDRYYVAGHSSGGPCALACGSHSDNRVKGVLCIAGDPEYAEEGAPKEIPVIDYLKWRWCYPTCACLFSLGNLCGPFSIGGARADYVVERKPYDFRTESIRVPALFYHGKNDQDLAPSCSAFTHSRLAGSEFMIVPGADHLSIVSHRNLECALERILNMT